MRWNDGQSFQWNRVPLRPHSLSLDFVLYLFEKGLDNGMVDRVKEGMVAQMTWVKPRVGLYFIFGLDLVWLVKICLFGMCSQKPLSSKNMLVW